MKILYLNPTGGFGGAERSLLDVIASLKIAEPDWTLALVAGGDGPLVERAREMGVATTVVALPDSLERIGDAGAGGPAGSQLTRLAMVRAMAGAACAVPRYTRRLGRQIDEIAPDLVHTNGFKMHVLGAWATRRKRPVVWHIHDYVSMRPVMAKLMRFEVRRCAAAIANSDSVRNDARAICGDGLEVFTVYNAVNLDEFNPLGRVIDLDALAGLATAPSGTIRVGLVATMARWKGHELFLRAMALLPGEAPVRAYVIGDAVYHTDGSQVSLETLRGKARALGLGDRVGFTGFVEDIGAAMRALDIVVHASTAPEPFGLGIAEAMASGKPVIASRAGGAAEIVEASGGALLYNPGRQCRAGRTNHATSPRPERARSLGPRRARERGAVVRKSPSRAGTSPDLQSRCEREHLMRVLHIVSGRLYGGVERLLVTLARCRSICSSIEPEFALCFDGRLHDELAATGTPVHMLGEVRARNPLSVLRARRQLRTLLIERRTDIVVCHMAWAQAMFGGVAHAAGVPLVFWMHGASDARHWLERWARLTPPDLAICNSQFTAGMLPLLYPHAAIEVIYCPLSAVVADSSIKHRETVRKELDTPLGATVIAQVSRMEPWKGHRVHLEALATMRDLPGWICWMIGGAQRPQEISYELGLRDAARQLGIEERVRFLGQRNDVSRLLSAADIYCQPNIKPEPFGLSLIEALDAWLPVVTSALGGALEVIDSSCGFLVSPNSSAEVASALRRLVIDDELRHRLGNAGPERARVLTDPTVQIVRLKTALDTVLPSTANERDHKGIGTA